MPLPARVSRGMTVDPFEAMHREFDTALGRLFSGRDVENGSGWGQFAVDIREDGDHFFVEAELPGFRKDEIDVTLENQTLTISAERKSDKENKSGDWLLRERRYARFLRSFTLPPTVNDQSVQAKLNDGLLLITLNKREETKPRKVQVG